MMKNRLQMKSSVGKLMLIERKGRCSCPFFNALSACSRVLKQLFGIILLEVSDLGF